jgi:hypothetical protein
MAEVISLLSEDRDDDALDLEERVAPTNVPPGIPEGTFFGGTSLILSNVLGFKFPSP